MIRSITRYRAPAKHNSAATIQEYPFKIHGTGTFTASVPWHERHKVGWHGMGNTAIKRVGDRAVFTGARTNAFTDQGVQIVLDRAFNLNGPPSAISHIGVSDDTDTVTAATTFLDPSADDNVTIVAFSPAASRTGNVVTAGGPFTEANVAFVINKVALLNAATDTGSSVIDIIGGTGGSSPYDEPFSIDLTSVSEFDLQLEIDVELIPV